MFALFNRRAIASAACTEPAAIPGASTQSAQTAPAPENDVVAPEQPATYDELYPYLILAMVAAV